MIERRGAEARQIDDGEFGNETFKFGGFRAAQQMPNEKGVPRVFRHDARIQTMPGIGACEQIFDVNFLMCGECDEIPEQTIELLRRHRLGVVPPDRLIGLAVTHDIFVFGRASGVLASLDDDGPAGC